MSDFDWRRAVVRVLCVAGTLAVASTSISAQATATAVRRFPLTSVDGVRPNHVTLSPAILNGKRGVRLEVSDSVRRSLDGRPIDQQQVETFAILDGTAFTDGVIDVEVAGAPAPGAQRAPKSVSKKRESPSSPLSPETGPAPAWVDTTKPGRVVSIRF